MTWSEWLKEGFYVNFLNLENVREYHRIVRRSFAHIEWEFGYPDMSNANRVVPPLTLVGPYIPGGINNFLASTQSNMLHQVIHGHKPACYVYREWPAEDKRHGFPKKVWTSSELREVAHFTMEMSPFDKPSFITEFFLLKNILETIDFDVYNPSDEIVILPRFNFMAAKLQLQRVGTVKLTEEGVVLTPSGSRYKETLKMLWEGRLYSRPITFAFPRSPSSG